MTVDKLCLLMKRVREDQVTGRGGDGHKDTREGKKDGPSHLGHMSFPTILRRRPVYVRLQGKGLRCQTVVSEVQESHEGLRKK